MEIVLKKKQLKHKPLQSVSGFAPIKSAATKTTPYSNEEGEESPVEDDDVLEELEAKVEGWRITGCDFAEKGNYRDALRLWQKCLTINPKDYRVHELKAQAFIELDMIVAAVQSAEMAVELSPNWVDGLQTLARCQRELGELEISLKTYLKALSLTTSESNLKEELLVEMNEVQTLYNKLEMKRHEQFHNIKSSEDPDVQEVNRCFFHLSARLRPNTNHSVAD